MTTGVDYTWLVESCVVDVRPQEPVTADRLLRRLDVLRQRLAVRWCGSAGAFAGYDELRMTGQGVHFTGSVHLEARMVEAQEKWHVVEFSAVHAVGGTASDATEHTVIAVGRGRTLQVAGAEQGHTRRGVGLPSDGS